LIVDDNLFNIMPIKSLTEEEFKVFPETAINGQIAVDLYKEGYKKVCKCKNRAFKLIIMDIQMPVMNGIQASR
jgi:CheY-like chemotaxis protein